MSETVFITGGGGYIGSILTEVLLQESYHVCVLDTFSHKMNSLGHLCHYPNLEIIRADCRNEELVKQACKNADWVIPLAALVGAPICAQDPIGATSINYDAIKMLINSLSVDQRVILPVTNSGYGTMGDSKFCDENSPLNPISLYGRLKVDAEKLVLDRENSISFRLATVFGFAAKMRIDLLVNDFTYRAHKDRSVVIFEGHFKRNYIHVRDVALAFLHGMQNFDAMKQDTFNLGLSEANLSKIELANTIKKYSPNFTIIESEIGQDPDKRDYIVSNEKLEATGWSPQFSLDNGIQELLKGYKTIQNEVYSNV